MAQSRDATLPITWRMISLDRTSSSAWSIHSHFRTRPLILHARSFSFFTGNDPTNGHFFTGNDPTNGQVKYLDAKTAQSQKLAFVQDDNTIQIGVDATTTLQPGQPRGSYVSMNDV